MAGIRNLAALLALALVGGCTSLQPATDVSTVGPGDEVRITTANQEFEFKVVEVTEHVIEGDGVVVAIEDVETLEKRQFSVIKSAGATAATTLGILLFAILFACPLC